LKTWTLGGEGGEAEVSDEAVDSEGKLSVGFWIAEAEKPCKDLLWLKMAKLSVDL
jgi:hypothetical protein